MEPQAYSSETDAGVVDCMGVVGGGVVLECTPVPNGHGVASNDARGGRYFNAPPFFLDFGANDAPEVGVQPSASEVPATSGAIQGPGEVTLN